MICKMVKKYLFVCLVIFLFLELFCVLAVSQDIEILINPKVTINLDENKTGNLSGVLGTITITGEGQTILSTVIRDDISMFIPFVVERDYTLPDVNCEFNYSRIEKTIKGINFSKDNETNSLIREKLFNKIDIAIDGLKDDFVISDELISKCNDNLSKLENSLFKKQLELDRINNTLRSEINSFENYKLEFVGETHLHWVLHGVLAFISFFLCAYFMLDLDFIKGVRRR